MNSSITFSKKRKSYTLVEKESKLGGLLQSKIINNIPYDYGTHFLQETGIEDLDGLLLDNADNSLIKLPFLKAGSYFKGKLNDKSPSISLKNLRRTIRNVLFRTARSFK